MESFGIHWFRRDLRLAGNPALQWSWKQHQGRVVGLFCFDAGFLARSDFSVNRFQFFLETLRALREELREQGSDLLFLDVGPEKAFPKLFSTLPARPATFSWNRDYEPFAVERDARIAKLLSAEAIAHHTEPDHCLVEPIEIFKGEDRHSAYQVFTPYSRRWLELFRTPEIQARIQRQKKGLSALKKRTGPAFRLTWGELLPKAPAGDLLESYLERNGKGVTVKLPPAGTLAAIDRLSAFKKKLGDYAESRDVPSSAGTSGMSVYFKNGSFTVAQAIAHLGLEPYGKKAETGADKFLSELIWREFYYHVLGRFPRVEKEAFQTNFGRIAWENREDWFEAWKEGRTGFPIVDAGMRQLKTTGWMHNRVRMIVASFLTKDLLVDYKWGEKYFMEQLLDGDLAPNNGGWQWAASTGCDPQPYFRIFNPLLQSQKFDPEGTYIRRYVPELAHLAGDSIHEPSPLERGSYPQPIVEHATQREKALALYKRFAK